METSPAADELPTVATIIGCGCNNWTAIARSSSSSSVSSPEQLTDTNGLVATPLAVPGGLGEGDEAIQKVILENFCTRFMSKKERDSVRCDICNVTCTGELAYKTHLAGKQHAKKLKEFEAGKKVVDDPYIFEDPYANIYECTLCNVKLNAKNQIAAHVSGTKHKNRLAPNEKIYSAIPNRIPYEEDLSGSLLYCPACDVHANSTLQMEQHVTSAKHVNRINGNFSMTPDRRMLGPKPAPPCPPGRYMPYNQNKDHGPFDDIPDRNYYQDRNYDRFCDYPREPGPPYDIPHMDNRARFRERYLSQEREMSLVERAYHDSYHHEPGYDNFRLPPMGGDIYPPRRGPNIMGGGNRSILGAGNRNILGGGSRNILGGGGRSYGPPGGPPGRRGMGFSRF